MCRLCFFASSCCLLHQEQAFFERQNYSYSIYLPKLICFCPKNAIHTDETRTILTLVCGFTLTNLLQCILVGCERMIWAGSLVQYFGPRLEKFRLFLPATVYFGRCPLRCCRQCPRQTRQEVPQGSVSRGCCTIPCD